MVAALGTTAHAVALTSEPQLVNDADLQAKSVTIGGATVLPTTKTIAHWHGQTTDPSNGVTYGYNMVGADPSTCSGADCDTTIQVDITPIKVVVGGLTLDGSDVLAATLDSPQFATNDYGSTPAATQSNSTRGAGGALSQQDAGQQLQLQDATMRAQFAKTGSSTYHLRLHPNVTAPVTITVPSNQGGLIQSGRGVVGASIDVGWWSSQINNLETSADPTHLPLYLTDNVFLHTGKSLGDCCIIGYHGTKAAGDRLGNGKTQGNAPVQTFAWASYVRPGFYSRANGGVNWALQDIHAISHEIAEWADDPFVNNTVNPWLTPTAPQYGCTGVLETGDPVVGIGFAMGTNTFAQGPNPNGTVSADGAYHPEDEALLPWFLRLPSNATGSEPNQTSPGGRYTLMGDLNPFPGFRAPATGC
ncbi:hypothetical protein N865_19060 [Intrasporangium oryzae NRRL B-24470]|uniref:Uncharacterized protein n=2 Tax=Intrasporangium TaxID=53357 RepID=W9GEW7_9MICO|nr:hypothetical protein N865_19060 [Intrasporangium oryzae NRRL B-24470]